MRKTFLTMTIAAGLLLAAMAVLGFDRNVSGTAPTRSRISRPPANAGGSVSQEASGIGSAEPLPPTVSGPSQPSPQETPTPPPEVQGDPRRLEEWLLSLPNPAFRPLVHSKQLRGYYRTILASLQEENRSEEAYLAALGAFTERINKKILESQGLKAD